ncbi:hypothetical protein [uncultured Algibacter sp.]|uniref:hypothetical protein n=1 Tax=uncultured Algibacter sp. TaxID=298659 RepID=UPI00260A6753|nr:hypothetical protein [uncultured Algibacter sp.]
MRNLFVLFVLMFLCHACDDIIGVKDISSSSVKILAPTNNTVLKDTLITFSWEIVEDAERYHIQVATPSFSNALQIEADSTLAGTSFSTTLGFKTYEWRVSAENSDYNTGYTIQSFKIEE